MCDANIEYNLRHNHFIQIMTNLVIENGTDIIHNRTWHTLFRYLWLCIFNHVDQWTISLNLLKGNRLNVIVYSCVTHLVNDVMEFMNRIRLPIQMQKVRRLNNFLPIFGFSIQLRFCYQHEKIFFRLRNNIFISNLDWFKKYLNSVRCCEYKFRKIWIKISNKIHDFCIQIKKNGLD